MMIIDTHCHLIDNSFADDLTDVIERAISNQVEQIWVACCNETEAASIVRLCQQYPHTLIPTLGLHPEEMAQDVKSQLQALRQQLAQYPQIAAIGEIGIDLHWDQTRLDDQLYCLHTQVEWAIEYDLPVLFHIRDAMPEFLKELPVLTKKATDRGQTLRGILHCYSGTIDEAEQVLQYGNFLFGIGGTLTYKKSQIPAFVQTMGLQHLVLETDAPYLAPVPKRGRRNEPAFTIHTAQAMANILNLPWQTVAQTTSENALRLLRKEHSAIQF